MKLRPYQSDCTESVMTDYENAIRRLLAVIAVSGGKSVVIAHIVKRVLAKFPKGRAVVVTHRKELLEQNLDKLIKVWPEIWNKAGIEKAELRCDPDHQIMVASNATIGKEGLPRVRRWAQDLSEIKAVIIDEAHHSCGTTYKTIIEEILEQSPDCLLLGLTGTPKRGDGERLDKIYKKISYTIDLFDLWRLKYIAGIRGWKIKTKTDIAHLKTRGGDFREKELQDAVNTEERNRLAIDTYIEKHRGEPAIFFCVGKGHAEDLRDQLRARGVSAEFVTDDTPKDEREGIVTRFKAGKINALCNVGVFTEGFDYWGVRVIFLLRPTKSPVLLTQMIGRGVRPYCFPNPEDPDGEWLVDWTKKSHCDVYDLVDVKAQLAGAQRVATLAGLRSDYELNGDDIFATKEEIDRDAELHPLMAEAIRNVNSKEELEKLVNQHDFLTELRMIQFTEEIEGPFAWAKVAEEFWLQLTEGEIPKLRRSALGDYELELPELKIGKRKQQDRAWRPNQPDAAGFQLQPEEASNPDETLPAQTIHISTDDPTEAIQQASEIVLQKVPQDEKIIRRDAAWKTRAEKEEPTPNQIQFLRNHRVPEDAVRTLNKRRASEWIERLKLRERIWDNEGRMTTGKYTAIDGLLVAIFDPDYWARTENMPKLLNRCPGALQQVNQQNVLDWLQKRHPTFYTTEVNPAKTILNACLHSDRKKALFLLRTMWIAAGDHTWEKTVKAAAKYRC